MLFTSFFVVVVILAPFPRFFHLLYFPLAQKSPLLDQVWPHHHLAVIKVDIVHASLCGGGFAVILVAGQ